MTENGAIAQRSGAPFTPPLIPADNFTVGDFIGSLPDQLISLQPDIVDPCAFQDSFNFVLGVFSAQIGVGHGCVFPFSQDRMADVKSGTDGQPLITGGWLDTGFPERSVRKKF